jgi:hypothetical protein
MKGHQVAVQAAEILPLVLLMDDTKIGTITEYAMIDLLH